MEWTNSAFSSKKSASIRLATPETVTFLSPIPYTRDEIHRCTSVSICNVVVDALLGTPRKVAIKAAHCPSADICFCSGGDAGIISATSGPEEGAGIGSEVADNLEPFPATISRIAFSSILRGFTFLFSELSISYGLDSGRFFQPGDTAYLFHQFGQARTFLLPVVRWKQGGTEDTALCRANFLVVAFGIRNT